MFEEYLMAFLTSRGFKYAATFAWMFGSSAWRILKKAATFIILFCMVLICIHYFLGISYSVIFGEIRLLLAAAMRMLKVIWSLILEFWNSLRANIE